MGFYYENVGEVVSQVYKVEAASWEEAKKKAFPEMSKGDILAECPCKAIKGYDSWPDYHYIDDSLCANYSYLECGTWINCGAESEYWENCAWFFSDVPDEFFNSDGTKFVD